MSPLYNSRKQLEIYVIGFLILISLIYGGFRAYPILDGPKITVDTPKDGDYVASSTFQISGVILRAKEITLQGRPITIDNNGGFLETLVPQFPYTDVVLVAKDNFGSEVVKTLRVIPK